MFLFLLLLRVQEKKDEQKGSQDDSFELVMSNTSNVTVDQEDYWNENSVNVNTNRTSTIRWKEPSLSIDEQPSFVPQSNQKNAQTCLQSSLKSSEKTSSKLLTQSFTELFPQPLPPPHPPTPPPPPPPPPPTSSSSLLLPGAFSYSAQSPSSISSDDGNQWPISQTIKIKENTSISLEDISLAGDSNCGFGGYDREKQLQRQQSKQMKTWSFDDLSILKQQLSIPTVSPSEQDKICLLYAPSPQASVIIPSPRRSNIIDDVKIQNMSKEDIITMWRSSERELLNSLQDALHQKKVLQEQLSVLQRKLMKPM